MTSHRPNRPQLPIDATLEKLLRCRESQVDAQAVDVFVTLVSRKGLQDSTKLSNRLCRMRLRRRYLP